MDDNPVILSRAQYKTLIDRIAELEAQNEALMRHSSNEADYSKKLEAQVERVRKFADAIGGNIGKRILARLEQMGSTGAKR